MPGMIIKDKLPMFMKGYPTVSDKYNVAGATLTGSTTVKFGDPLVWATGNSNGYYVKSAIGTSVVTAASDFAGFCVATNVKLASGFPGTEVETKAGEALNLLINGYIAVQLGASSSLASSIKPGAKVYITANGVLTTSSSSTFDTGYVCTGAYEVIIEDSDNSNYQYLVEVCKG